MEVNVTEILVTKLVTFFGYITKMLKYNLLVLVCNYVTKKYIKRIERQ